MFRTIDLSPGRWRRSPFYHLTRAARTVSGVLRILAGPLTAECRRYIMSVDGGLGLAYNIALALAARLTGQAMLLYHHSSRYVQDDSVLMRMLLIAAGNVPHVFCSPRMASLFFDRYRVNGSTILINNAAWVASVPKVGKRREGGIRLGFLSALTVEKGVGRAIETLRMIHSQGVAGSAPGIRALTGLPGRPARPGQGGFFHQPGLFPVSIAVPARNPVPCGPGGALRRCTGHCVRSSLCWRNSRRWRSAGFPFGTFRRQGGAMDRGGKGDRGRAAESGSPSIWQGTRGGCRPG